MKKRILSGLLALALIFGSAAVLPEGVFDDGAGIVASADVSGDYEYMILDNGTAEITKYKGANGVVTIPSTIGGKKVTSIDSGAFYNCTSLTRVTIPSSVKSIGGSAFYECIRLKSVTIPNNVTSIGANAFEGCSSLTSLTIPNSVISIGNEAFWCCANLKSVTISNRVTRIGDRMFGHCNSLTSVTIPSSVTSIGYLAFWDCTKLKSVTIPSSVTSIDAYAFRDCTNLISVTIPGSVTSIGSGAFGLYYDNNRPSKVSNFTVYGEIDSVAQTYANGNGYKFIAIPKSTRLAGAGRYATAANISKAGFPDGSDTVVLAYGLNYADALAGVPLAKAMNAPILLTNTKTLDATTLAEIKRLKAKNVIILGGTGAVGEEVESALKKEGLKTERIAGATRFETATKIAEKMQKLSGKAPEDVFFVYGLNYADALSVSTVAALKNAPIIYLTTKGNLNADTAAYLAKIKGSVKNAYVIGGDGVISNDMMKKAGNALGVTPKRVFGANRFETCVAVNEKFADVLDGDMLCVATGMDFPDALAGGVYAALNKAPLFLINGKAKTPNLNDAQKAYLKGKNAATITTFGGEGVVPDSHIADIAKNSI